MSVTNSTFAENASQYGGGIYTDGGMVTLTNLTLSNNTATTNGGNVYTGEGTVTTKNSIFAGGTSSNCNTDLTTNGHNISSDGTCGFTDGTDQESVNPKLDPEGPKVPPSGPTLNGSPYLSIVGIAADSRAVDNGDSCTSTDELGGTRVGTCDIGAYEYNASTVPAISSSQVFNTPNIIVTRLDDPDGGTCSSGTNCSLRQAVALSTSGQTIGFSSGLVGTLTLGGFITVDHPITISGPGEKLLTISGNSSTNLFDVTSAGSLELDHLTIANGQNLTGDAGAIYNLGPVNTSHVTFRNNAASGEGGAIYSDCGVENRNQTFDYTTFEGNYSGEAGGAIYTCGNSSGLNTNTITNGTLVDNFANGKGGAIYASSESVSVSGSTLDGNYGADEGGAIYTNMTYSAEPIITVSNSTFAGNWAQDGGAISNGLSSGVHLDVSGDTSFLGNFAYDNGGAINLSGAYIDSMSATFQGNFSNWDAGGALYLGGLLDSSVTINNSTFTDNVAGDDVGGAIAIFSEGTDLAMTGTTSFTGNSALYDNAGGAIYDDAHSLTLTGTTFNNNTTWSGTGGAIYVQNGDLTMTGASFNNNVAMDTNAGAIDYEASGALSVTNSSFVGNQAIYGGSGAVLQGESTAAATVSGSTFTNNMAYDDPVGAWYQYAGDLTVTNSTFTGNSSTNQVGGINTDSGNLTITGTTFDHNSSVGYGASLYDHQSDGYTTTIKNSTFYRNDAPWDESGGYYHDGGSNAVINNVTFDQNVSSTDGGNAFTVYGSPTVITNSIFAGSPLGSCIDYNGGIDQVNSTNNIDDGSGCFDAGVNNQNNVNPLSIFASAGLADNGGQTATVDLANSSPALDAGNDATCETTDQTGASRPYGAHCDVGSVESHALLDETAPETPVASPSTGTYSGAQSVILSSVGSDSIRYSTSVAPADCSSGTIYSGAISIASSETLYVRACKSSNSTSSTASFAYTIIPPSSGSVSGGSSVGWVPSTSSTQSKGITSSNTFVIQNNGTTYHFPRSQKTGVKGDDVKVLQQFLNTHGFVIVPNGPGSKGKETKTFGPATKKALINYQKSKGLNPDGILGPKTRAMIESDMNK